MMEPSSSSSSTTCSHQLNDEWCQYLHLILDIITSKNWQMLDYAIRNNTHLFQLVCQMVSQSSVLNGLTILHACVRFDPPPHIIEMLLYLDPKSSSLVDCMQRTPLHVASGTGASLPVIKLLTDACPAAVYLQDGDGKTPLHLACDSSCELFEGDEDSTRLPPSYEIVKTLIYAGPSSVPIEDQDGMSALEYAILSDAPIEVVKLLQYVTRKYCEKEQKREEEQESLKESQRKNNSDPQSQPSMSRIVSYQKMDLRRGR